MKKIFSLTFAAIIFVAVFAASPAVRANAYIDIKARVEFRPDQNQLDIVANLSAVVSEILTGISGGL